MSADLRYRKLAAALLSSPDPITAVAEELGDQAGRLDALASRLHVVECAVKSAKVAR